jgi:hypothetical protein
MQQKLLRKAGLLSILLTAVGFLVAGCVDEPNPTVVPPMTTLVRFVHATPDDNGSMDIWLDSKVYASAIAFKGNTPYITVPSGDHFVRIVPSGQDTAKAVFRQATSFRSLYKMTAVFAGSAAASDIILLTTQERLSYADETTKLVDSADIKLININVGGLPVSLAQGASRTEMFAELTSPNLSIYHRFKTGSYDFYLLNAAKADLKNFQMDLVPHYRYTFVVVGTGTDVDVLRLQDEPFVQ